MGLIFILLLFGGIIFILQPLKKISLEHASNAAVKPNAFVTFHVNNQKVYQHVQHIQMELYTQAPEFLPNFQSIKSLHLTLIIVQLNNTNFERAKLALHSAIRKFIVEQPRGLNASFRGLSNFGQETLFAALERQSSYRIVQLYDFVKSEFNSHGIPSLSQFPIFHPHMSLVNLAKTQQKWLSQFWPSIELEWEKRLLGTQQVHGTSIQVLYENVEVIAHIYVENIVETSRKIQIGNVLNEANEEEAAQFKKRVRTNEPMAKSSTKGIIIALLAIVIGLLALFIGLLLGWLLFYNRPSTIRNLEKELFAAVENNDQLLVEQLIKNEGANPNGRLPDAGVPGPNTAPLGRTIWPYCHGQIVVGPWSQLDNPKQRPGLAIALAFRIDRCVPTGDCANPNGKGGKTRGSGRKWQIRN